MGKDYCSTKLNQEDNSIENEISLERNEGYCLRRDAATV